jgi:hypothetical protein
MYWYKLYYVDCKPHPQIVDLWWINNNNNFMGQLGWTQKRPTDSSASSDNSIFPILI